MKIQRRSHQVLSKDSKGTFDFHRVTGFAKNYLHTYYSEKPTPDEIVVMKFLTKYLSRIKRPVLMIEIGCGPTVHHLLPINNFVSEIHIADYLQENLDEIKLWKKGSCKAHNWNQFTKLTLRLEDRAHDQTAIDKRERETRKKITKMMKCDLKNNSPLPTNKTYAVVSCFYCAEEVGISIKQWEKVMLRLTTIVQPGGLLFMAALRATDFYYVVSKHGHFQKFPCAFITEDDFMRILPKLGFDMHESIVKVEKIKGQEKEGVNSVVLIAAKKFVR